MKTLEFKTVRLVGITEPDIVIRCNRVPTKDELEFLIEVLKRTEPLLPEPAQSKFKVIK